MCYLECSNIFQIKRKEAVLNSALNFIHSYKRDEFCKIFKISFSAICLVELTKLSEMKYLKSRAVRTRIAIVTSASPYSYRSRGCLKFRVPSLSVFEFLSIKISPPVSRALQQTRSALCSSTCPQIERPLKQGVQREQKRAFTVRR